MLNVNLLICDGNKYMYFFSVAYIDVNVTIGVVDQCRLNKTVMPQWSLGVVTKMLRSTCTARLGS